MDKRMQFFMSARDGDLTKVRSLLDDGVDIDAENAGGATALEMASEAGQFDVVNYLIAQGARVDPIQSPCFSSALITSSTNHHAKVVNSLLENGANPNLLDREGQTALIWASFHGAPLEIIEALVAHGADPALTDAKGLDAVVYASEAGHTLIADYLRQQMV